MSEATKNKIEFGIESLHFAPFKNGRYETPELIKGAAALKMESSTETIKIYADNTIFYTMSANNGYGLELDIYNYDDDFMVKYLGFKKDKNGILVEPSILVPIEVGVLFKVKGDLKDRCCALYKCTFEKPSLENKTIEDKIEVPTVKLKGIASPQTFTDYHDSIVRASTIEESKKATWFSEVYVPVKQEE